MKTTKVIVFTIALIGIIGLVLFFLQKGDADLKIWHGLYITDGMGEVLASKWEKVEKSPDLSSFENCKSWATGVRQHKNKPPNEPEDAYICTRDCRASWIDDILGHGDEQICAEVRAGGFQKIEQGGTESLFDSLSRF